MKSPLTPPRRPLPRGLFGLGLLVVVGCSAAASDPAPGAAGAAPAPPAALPAPPAEAAEDAAPAALPAPIPALTDGGDGAVLRDCGVGTGRLCFLGEACLASADCLTPSAECRAGVCSPLCLAGSYITGAACAPCAFGAYSDTPGAAACTPCGPRMTTLKEGSSSAAACVPLVCPPGTFISGAGCGLCSPGTYSDAADSAACAPCPDNTSAPNAGASSCAACPAGETSNAASGYRCITLRSTGYFTARVVRRDALSATTVVYADDGGWTVSVRKVATTTFVTGRKGADSVLFSWVAPRDGAIGPITVQAETGVWGWTNGVGGVYGTVESWDPTTRVFQTRIAGDLRRVGMAQFPGVTRIDSTFTVVLPP